MSISSNIFRGWGAHRPSSDSMISSALAVGKGGTRSCRFSHRKGPSDMTYDDNTGRKSMVLYMKYPCSRYSNYIIISQSAMCRDSNSCSKQSMLVILYMSSCYLETITVGLGEFECFLQSRTSEFVTIWNYRLFGIASSDVTTTSPERLQLAKLVLKLSQSFQICWR